MTFTSDWFSHNIPVWQQMLGHFKDQPNLDFLEIGSYEGRSAQWMLESILTHHTAKLHCVDPFSGSLLERFKENIANFKNKVLIYQGRSEDMLPTINAKFDMVYIDGLHTSFNVLQDAALTWNKLKTGGIMVFDDYLWGHLQMDRTLCTKDGVDAFLNCITGRYELLALGHQVIIRKNDKSPQYDAEYFRVCQQFSTDLQPVF